MLIHNPRLTASVHIHFETTNHTVTGIYICSVCHEEFQLMALALVCMYVCDCVCVCACAPCVCVCVCACAPCVCTSSCLLRSKCVYCLICSHFQQPCTYTYIHTFTTASTNNTHALPLLQRPCASFLQSFPRFSCRCWHC
jgi:hypothetical protein